MDKKTILMDNKEKIKKLEKDIEEIYYNARGDYEEDMDFEENLYLLNDPGYQASSYEKEKRKLLLENRRITHEMQKVNFDNEFDHMSKNFKSGNISSDNESNVDRLGRELMAKTLVRHIIKKDIETPINIGVFGEWGEGKSSFLRLMQKEIKILNKTNYNHICHTHIIKYNASEYDEKNKIWASLLSSMFKEFENDKKSLGKIKFTCYNIRKSFEKNRIKYIINSIIIITSIIWLNCLTGLDNSAKLRGGSLIAITGAVPLILFLTNILIPFVKKQLEFIKPLSDRVLSFVDTPDYSKELGARENIKNTFNDLINVWIDGKSERIVIFIDELDRCTDKAITEFFDAMQLLLSVKGITVVLSVDYKTVCYSLANNNKHYFSGDIDEIKKLEFGMEYLKKYINIPIHLLKIENYGYYISDIMENINELEQNNVENNFENEEITITTNDGKTLSEEEMTTINNIINWVNKSTHLTPREIKNIINILILSKEIIFSSNLSIKDDEKIDFRKYLRWMLFHYFNRRTSKNLLKKISKMDKDYLYSTIKEGKDELKFSDIFYESEKLCERMFSILDNLSINEIIKFKDISFWFVG